MNDLDEVLPQFCPSCGTGTETSGAPGTGLLIRLPRGYPFDQPCDECKRRSRIRWVQIGAKLAKEHERAFLDSLPDWMREVAPVVSPMMEHEREFAAECEANRAWLLARYRAALAAAAMEPKADTPEVRG